MVSRACDPLVKARDGDSKESADKQVLDLNYNERDTARDTRNIRWTSPTLMVASLLLGIMLSVAHHSYYKWLNGQDVGSTDEQQWSLRLGNTFAISAALCFKTAVGVACIQLLWKTFRTEYVKLETVNDCFELSTNVRAFFNKEVFSKIKLAAVLAIIIWCLPISSLIAPATLSVGTSHSTSLVEIAAYNPNISTNEPLNNFTVHASTDKSGAQGGVRMSSRMARIIAAVAYSGERLPFDALSPIVNGTYNLHAFVPLVKCTLDSSEARDALFARASNQSLDKLMPATWKNYTNVSSDFSYYALPDRFLDYARAGVFGYIAALNQTTIYDTSTELFVGILRPQMSFLTCKVWNASVSYTAQAISSTWRVKQVKTEFINEVREGCKDLRNPPCQTYHYFFKELANYIQGYLASATHYYASSVESEGNVLNTNLALGNQWYQMASNISGERHEIAPLSRIRNTTFAEDIESLALNVSLSTMSDPSLCIMENVTATSVTTSTVYIYKPRNLFITYGASILLSVLSVIAGAYAMYVNGFAYDASPTVFGLALRQDDIKDVLQQQGQKKGLFAKAKVKFDPDKGFMLKTRSGHLPHGE